MLTDFARHHQGCGHLEASLGLLGGVVLRESFLFLLSKTLCLKGVFVGLSCMKTVIDGMSLFVAKGTYHSWAESMFSAERWRRNGVSSGVVQLTAFVVVSTAPSVLMKV